jgi:preprotein translocase subunit YajC
LSFFFLPLLGLFVIFLFTIILKEQKQKKNHKYAMNKRLEFLFSKIIVRQN